jgi:uncharacterized membrane protein YdjX (TVP38/TMEM64 family)
LKFTAEEIKKYMKISFSKFIFKHMDKFALPVKTTVFFTLLLLVLVFGYSDPLFLSSDKISDFFSEVKGTYFALPVTIIIFCILAFLGVPQWILISGSLFAFGSLDGAFYSWVSTLISAVLNFTIGYWLGHERISRYNGKKMVYLKRFLNKNSIYSSFIVRLFPSGPFILINMAAGASSIKLIPFLIGTSLGIIPKILILALLSNGILLVTEGQLISLTIIIIALIILIFVLIKRKLSNSEDISNKL